ncbi:MAG: response regulator [Myxococcales bacterium]
MNTILVVDDDDSTVEFLARLLELHGYAVLTASNGQEALERASATVPALIITDQRMPIMTGPELFRSLQKSHRLRQVPVILVTSGPPAKARDLHWAQVIRKPLEFEALLRAIDRVFREAAERSALA